MTVTLPAWPARFRTSENRLLLESMLQEECPAHILLRILWLVPHDMCRFESYYRGWLDTLACEAGGHQPCPAFAREKFIDFLFTDIHPILENCSECTADSSTHPTPPADEWLQQVNLLYGWNAPPSAEVTQATAASPYLTNDRDRRRLFTARVTRYQEQVEEWGILSHQEALAGKTAAFLKDPDPGMKRFESLLTELIRAEKTTPPHGHPHTGPGLHRLSLAGITISFYLDKVIMDPGDGTKWEHFVTTWQTLKIEIDQPEQFYREWQPEEMQQLVRDLDPATIRALFRGEHPTTHK